MRKYRAPYRPELRHPEDTQHFDSDIPPVVSCGRRQKMYVKQVFQPLAPANGAPADATRDPMLRDEEHGPEILDVRKAYAFAGFTHKSPRMISYLRADKAFLAPPSETKTISRGRQVVRETREVGKGRAISM